MNFTSALKRACVSAWENYKNNLGFIMGATLISLLAFMGAILVFVGLMAGVGRVLGPVFSSIILFFGVISILFVAMGLYLGWMKFMLDVHDHKELKTSTLFGSMKLGSRPWLAIFISLIGSLIIMAIGLFVFSDTLIEMGKAINTDSSASAIDRSKLLPLGIFFGIPAAAWFYYFMTRFTWVTFLIVDQNATGTQAVDMSSNLTKGYFWLLLGLTIVLSVVQQLMRMIPIVGFFLTFQLFPYTTLIYAYLYRWTTNKQDEAVN